MIDLHRDNKSLCWIITRTGPEGFHTQLNVTDSELGELYWQIHHKYVLEDK